MSKFKLWTGLSFKVIGQALNVSGVLRLSFLYSKECISKNHAVNNIILGTNMPHPSSNILTWAE